MELPEEERAAQLNQFSHEESQGKMAYAHSHKLRGQRSKYTHFLIQDYCIMRTQPYHEAI